MPRLQRLRVSASGEAFSFAFPCCTTTRKLTSLQPSFFLRVVVCLSTTAWSFLVVRPVTSWPQARAAAPCKAGGSHEWHARPVEWVPLGEGRGVPLSAWVVVYQSNIVSAKPNVPEKQPFPTQTCCAHFLVRAKLTTSQFIFGTHGTIPFRCNWRFGLQFLCKPTRTYL